MMSSIEFARMLDIKLSTYSRWGKMISLKFIFNVTQTNRKG